MPIVKIEYDQALLPEAEVRTLCEAVQAIVAKITAIEDVSVFANCAHIRIKAAPIEIFVQISAHKVPDLETLTSQIKQALGIWKIGRKRFGRHPQQVCFSPAPKFR